MRNFSKLIIIALLVSVSSIAYANDIKQKNIAENIHLKAELFATITWGANILPVDNMVYYDYLDNPFALGVCFKNRTSNEILGTVIISLIPDTPPLIEIIHNRNYHKTYIDSVNADLKSMHKNTPTRARFSRFYYYPFLPPILKYKMVSNEGNYNVLLQGALGEEIDLELMRSTGEAIFDRPFPKSEYEFSDDQLKQWLNLARKNELMTSGKILDAHEINVKGDWVGCSPAAGTNLFGYLDDIGFDFLPNANSQTATKEAIDNLLQEVAEAMETTPFMWDESKCEAKEKGMGSTKTENICNGLELVGLHHGVHLSCILYNNKMNNDLWEIFKKSINSGTPVIFSSDPTGDSIFTNHAALGIGYEENTFSKIAIIHDGWPSKACKKGEKDVPRTVSWEWLGGLFKWQPLHMNTVEDIFNGKNASLEQYYEPNPVYPYEGQDLCYPDRQPEWHYKICIKETNGVGVKITHYTIDFYRGEEFSTSEERDATDFAKGFGSDYIEPNSTVCSSNRCATLGGYPNGYLIYTFYGIDDRGIEVKTEGRVNLNASSNTAGREVYFEPNPSLLYDGPNFCSTPSEQESEITH